MRVRALRHFATPDGIGAPRGLAPNLGEVFDLPDEDLAVSLIGAGHVEAAADADTSYDPRTDIR